MTYDIKVGTKGKSLSRFMQKEGKLFFYWNNEYPLTKEALKMFEKFNLSRRIGMGS